MTNKSVGGGAPFPAALLVATTRPISCSSRLRARGPGSTGEIAKCKAHLVQSTPPRPAPPEVRCLTLQVPVRRGWGVLLTGAAAAVAVIERARGAGLLVSGPKSGPGCGWGGGSGTRTLPFGVTEISPSPSVPPLVFGLSDGCRPQAAARPLF